jgi:hypothetical protein
VGGFSWVCVGLKPKIAWWKCRGRSRLDAQALHGITTGVPSRMLACVELCARDSKPERELSLCTARW